MKKIFCFHLLNDFSGSPKVLSQLIKGWIEHGYNVHLSSSISREGFLSNIDGLTYHDNKYSFRKNKVWRLCKLMWSQLYLIIMLIQLVSKDDVVYINTILPFGAAILGKLKGAKVIYHIHETSISPWILKKFLFGIAKVTASQAVYVSQFLSEQEKGFKNSTVLYNAIEDEFLNKAKLRTIQTIDAKNVLMICSLKKYKGVNEYVAIAKRCPNYQFRLVVNASEVEIMHFFQNDELPSNLEIFPTQKDVHPFYEWSHVVLNLSRIDEWLETFGLTVIEAGAYSKPVIVPPAGGITELITEGKEGFKVNSHEIVKVEDALRRIMDDTELYEKMSKSAFENVKNYSERELIEKSLAVIMG